MEGLASKKLTTEERRENSNAIGAHLARLSRLFGLGVIDSKHTNEFTELKRLLFEEDAHIVAIEAENARAHELINKSLGALRQFAHLYGECDHSVGVCGCEFQILEEKLAAFEGR